MIYHIMHKDIPVADVYTNEHHIFTERFYMFMKDRCYEDGRADLPQILAAAGMTENDPYEWCKRTHGVTYDDFFWIKYDGEEIAWKDVKLR